MGCLTPALVPLSPSSPSLSSPVPLFLPLYFIFPFLLLHDCAVSLDVNNDTYISLLVGGVNEFNIMVYNGGSIGSIAKRSVHEDHDVCPSHLSLSLPYSLFAIIVLLLSFDYQHELVVEPPIEDLPTSEFTFKTDFSEYNLKPHTGPQVLQASVQFPTERFASAKEAVVVQPVRFEEFTEPPTREESRSEYVSSLLLPSTFSLFDLSFLF